MVEESIAKANAENPTQNEEKPKSQEEEWKELMKQPDPLEE